MKRDRRTYEEMTRAGGEGLPPSGPGATVWLFTCRDCGSRTADGPGPVVECSCGSRSIVCHRFDRDTYHELRRTGRVSR